MQNCDGMVVWGEARDNVLLKQIAHEMTSGSGGSNTPGRTHPGGGGESGDDIGVDPTNGKDDGIHVLVQGM